MNQTKAGVRLIGDTHDKIDRSMQATKDSLENVGLRFIGVICLDCVSKVVCDGGLSLSLDSVSEQGMVAHSKARGIGAVLFSGRDLRQMIKRKRSISDRKERTNKCLNKYKDNWDVVRYILVTS